MQCWALEEGPLLITLISCVALGKRLNFCEPVFSSVKWDWLYQWNLIVFKIVNDNAASLLGSKSFCSDLIRPLDLLPCEDGRYSKYWLQLEHHLELHSLALWMDFFCSGSKATPSYTMPSGKVASQKFTWVFLGIGKKRSQTSGRRRWERKGTGRVPNLATVKC